MSLKRWAVRQISGLLSDYLEGITEQNLQASLSLEVGEVEISHVRVHPGLLSDQHLQLLSSDVSVYARIPWRNLGSEPTVITVRDVWAEVQAEPVATDAGAVGEESKAKAEEELRRWRTRRKRKVQARVEAAREAAAAAAVTESDDAKPRRGMAARLGHAALRQLQVRVDGLRARVHPEVASTSPLELFVVRLALDEGAARPGGVAVPEEVRRQPASLDKVLELVGLSAQVSENPIKGDLAWPEQRQRLEELQRGLECARDSETLATELGQVKAALMAPCKEASPLLGPFSLDARLWHSRVGGLLWLHTELQVSRSTAAISLSPSTAQYISEGLNWYSQALLAPPPGAVRERRKGSRDGGDNSGDAAALALPSGPEYLELCARRSKDEQQEGDERRLDEIEDLAPIEWLARWQLKSEEQLGNSDEASVQPAPKSGARRVLGWLQRRWRPADSMDDDTMLSEGAGTSSSSTSRPAPTQGLEAGDEDEAIDDLVEEADKESFFEEVEEPRRVEVRVVIPHCTILSMRPNASLGLQSALRALRLEGGVHCQMAMATAREGTMANFMKAAWDADVRTNLSSIAVLLGEEPLMLLRQDPAGTSLSVAAVQDPPSPECKRMNSGGDEDEFFDLPSDSEDDLEIVGKSTEEQEQAAAVCLSVFCARFGGSAASAGSDAALPWSVRVRLKQEPFRFLLAPGSTHDALDLVVSVVRAMTIARTSVDGLSAGMARAPEELEQAVPANPGAGTAEALALDLDLDVAAPVLRWGLLPKGHVTIALGRLVFRTSGQLPPPEQFSVAERCEWGSFSSYCQLTETSVTAQGEEGEECRVYEPSTMSLRVWRETDSSGWQLSLDSRAVRWTVNPTVLKIAGQLPMSLDYAISPLRDVLAEAGSAGPSRAASKAPEASAAKPPVASPRASADETLPPSSPAPAKVVVTVAVGHTELVLKPAADSFVSLQVEGILAEYSGHRVQTELMSQVALCHLTCENVPLVSFTRGASLKVRNADRHLSVAGGSTLIAVQWYEQRVRKVITAVEEAWECLVAGHESAQGLLPVGDSAGMFAQLWSRYVIQPIQARVRKRAAQRLSQLLPGLEGSSVTTAAESSTSELGDTPQEDTGSAAWGDEELQTLPEPRGQCSVEVSLSYEGLTAVFPGREEVDGALPPLLQVAVTGAECGFRAFTSGDASACVSLMSLNLELAGRRLLMPRRGDKLLRVDILRRAGALPPFVWTASWAQICILFRQRDYDTLSAFVRKSVLGALPSRRRAEAPPSVASDSSAATVPPESSEGKAEPQAPGARFRLDIGAPLFFLPTDNFSVSPPRLVQEDGNQWSDGGQLEVDADRGEPVFRPQPGEGFLLLDFGHLAASGGGSKSTINEVKLQLRGAQVLGCVPLCRSSATEEMPRVRELLLPLSLQAVLSTPSDGPMEFHATSLVADGDSVADHRMSLTRAQLTLIFDVLAENICYTGRSGALANSSPAGSPRSEPPSRTPSKEGAAPRRGFRFSWRWPGELALDLAFTEAVPLARLRLRGGILAFSSAATGTAYEIGCASLTVVDLRAKSKNVVKTLIESSGPDLENPGFRVKVDVPAEEDTLAVIQLQQPAMHVLPQLVMDVVTAGLSSWQHCTFRNDRVQVTAVPAPTTKQSDGRGYAAAPSSSSSKPDRGTRVQVNFLDGSFRIAEKWAEPTEHFEFAGSVMIHIMVHSEGIRIERFDLEGGALRIRSARRSPSTVCPCLEWSIRGEQRRIDDVTRMKRHANYDFRSVIIPPYTIRMSPRDHHAMANSLLELLSMDAETAEPASETQSRDPLALQLVENRLTLVAEVAIEGAEVQVMGEEGGQEWPGLRAHARCPLLQVTVESRQGSAPTINLFGRELEVDLWSHNHRLGIWEPVLPTCGWRFSYHTQRKPDGGPRDVVVRADVAAIKPVRLLISAPFVNLANRVFKESSGDMHYGHLLAGINISGMVCRVTVEDGSEGMVLASTYKAQPLDSLLKGRGRAGTATQPYLVLTLADHPDAQPCRVQVGREVDIAWDTKTAGFLSCRLVMPRPPQFVLLISSTVCVWNKTPADLEVRFLAPSFGGAQSERNGLQPVLPVAACRCMEARLLSEGVVPLSEADKEASSSSAAVIVDPRVSAEGTLRLRAGEILSAPTEAQLRMGQAVLQMRPASEASGGVFYEWSDPFFSVPVSSPEAGGITVCSAPPANMQEALPRHWLYVRTMSGGSPEEGWSNVEVQAPFTIVNACPCDVLCRLSPQVNRVKLGKEKERLPVDPATNIELAVDDGRGGEVIVPCGGQAEVLPLRLDDEGYFGWTCNGKRGRTKPRWRSTNCVIAVLNGRKAEVEWHCIQAAMGPDSSRAEQLRIAPQSVLPAFDTVAEDLTVSFALRDTAGHVTSWCLPLQAVASRRSATELVELEFKGMWIHLNALRHGRELVVYARWWFINSTGLDVRLLQPGGPGPLHPVACFGSQVCFLPEIRNDSGDGVAFVGLRNHAAVEARVPDVGGAEFVNVTPLHPCCLRTETVALPEAMRGVPSCLISLVPSIMLFNHAEEGLEVGFRQLDCPSDTAVWVPPGRSRALWWSSATDQGVQVAARKIDAVQTRTSWSQPFELKESRIGAYPITLKCGQSRYLLCVCIDQDGAIMAVTVKGSSSCHRIENKHPNIYLEASMEGVGEDPVYSFSVVSGAQAAFGGRGPPAASIPRLRLALQRSTDSSERAVVMVDLHRSGVHRVPLWAGQQASGAAVKKRKSTLRVKAAVSVVLRNRVALVTVMPGLPTPSSSSTAPSSRQSDTAADSGGEDAAPEETPNSRTFTGELRVDHLAVALLVEGPPTSLSPSQSAGDRPVADLADARQRREAFTVNLAGVHANIAQMPDRCRDVDFQIWDMQVDMQFPRRDVVLKSITQPFLRTHTRRDDVRMLDAHLREVKLAFGDLEVSVTSAFMEQARLLRRNLVQGAGGLTFEQVVAQAKGALHLSNPQPPPPSSKLLVSKLVVGDAKIDVWCRLHLPDAHYLPKSLRDTIQVVSFGATRLDVKGAQVKLPQQSLFSDREPLEGNFGVVLSRVSLHYLPHIKACWRSLLQHSNIFLGGLLSRHAWAPRQRRSWTAGPPISELGPAGEMRVRDLG
eukprot:TRINITY_DN36453_c0_g1_i1.p1 TRINITY_DN36453_c0_g1~~TRINITY_DN36453_c0_g1_i1.p1  ORF type:complete len:3105 (+),score=627.80 TRINITY_DN36453_c0_g1_i1:59-9373(+)